MNLQPSGYETRSKFGPEGTDRGQTVLFNHIIQCFMALSASDRTAIQGHSVSCVSFLVLPHVLTQFPRDAMLPSCTRTPENAPRRCARHSPSGSSKRLSRPTRPGSRGDDKLGKRRRCCVTRPRSFRRAPQVPDEHTPLAPFLQTYAGPTEAPRPEARRPPRNTFMRLMAERTRSNA